MCRWKITRAVLGQTLKTRDFFLLVSRIFISLSSPPLPSFFLLDVQEYFFIKSGIENKSDAEKLKKISILLPNQTLPLRNLGTLGCYTLNILWGQRFSLVRIGRIACDIFRDAQLCPFSRAHDHSKDTNCNFQLHVLHLLVRFDLAISWSH